MVSDKLAERFGRDAAEQIWTALVGLTHGSIQIIVQDSRIIQIDKVEKVRLDKRKER
jgi:hypothetical protein